MLSPAQKRIVESTEQKIVVVAAAASGKSRCLAERIKVMLNRGCRPDRMVAITFTNAAADELRKRIGNNEIFIGTVHSYANYLLNDKGYNTYDYITEEKFDEFFSEIKKNPEVIQPVDYLLLDEAQDTTENQYEFIFEMVRPKGFFVVGDSRQCVYEWNQARPDLFDDLQSEFGVETYELNENYRNDYKILDFAKGLLFKSKKRVRDESYSMSGELGEVLICEDKPGIILNYIQNRGKPSDWFVLTRTNSQLEIIYNFLVGKGVPCDTFRRSEISSAEFRSKMEANTVKVLTIHAAKGLEANNVVVIGAKNWNDEEVRVNYVAATRAKHLLIWTKSKSKTRQRYRSWD